MEELFEMLLQMCVNQDCFSLEQACTSLGLNIDKILEYSMTDHDAQNILKLCCNVMKGNIHEKFYEGTISKNEADLLVDDLDSVIEIYLNIPVQPPLEE